MLKNQKSSNRKNNISITQFETQTLQKEGEQEIVKQTKKKQDIKISSFVE